MKHSYYANPIRVEMDKHLVDRILRRMKVASLAQYLNIKLRQDLEQLL